MTLFSVKVNTFTLVAKEERLGIGIPNQATNRLLTAATQGTRKLRREGVKKKIGFEFFFVKHGGKRPTGDQ